jgi:hypothetical protein
MACGIEGPLSGEAGTQGRKLLIASVAIDPQQTSDALTGRKTPGIPTD